MNSNAVINSKSNDEQCFKGAVIAALDKKEIKHHHDRISLLWYYEDQCNWKGPGFPLATRKIATFYKNNPGIAVNVLFNSEKDRYTARRLELNGKCRKQAKLLVIVDGESRCSKTSLLYFLNVTNKGAYHFCTKSLNGIHTESARDKHYRHSNSNGRINVKMPCEKEKWPTLYDGQYQFKILFTLDAHFESILKSVSQEYREKMNKMKNLRKDKAPYTEMINMHVPPGWCVHSTLAYGNFLGLLKIYCDRDCRDVCRAH